MKIIIEIWQSQFNNEWICDITTRTSDNNAIERWAVENFCELLNLIKERFPKAVFLAQDTSGC